MRSRSLRTTTALVATRLVSGASRRAGLGDGSTVGGRVGLLVDPGLLATLGEGRRVALVSGTNGKTTTTRLLAEAMRTAGPVASSGAGANLPAGLVAALAAAPHAPTAVLEVDEGYLAAAISALRPNVVVLLNLSRDQLDRVSEVRMVASRWRDALADFAGVVVANVDDPLVAWAAAAAPTVRAVAVGGAWRGDAHHCPSCGARLRLETDGWACTCDLRRPEPDAALADGALVSPGAARRPISLRLPGRFNLANAALAAVAAGELGVPLDTALDAMSGVNEVAGRYASAEVGTSSVRLLLAKNPAGWAELLELVREGDAPVVIGINARVADGRDPSWLWDVPFELLAERHTIATGERRRDLAVRLRHAGVSHAVAADPLAAIAALDGPVEYIGNYTAFQELRQALVQPRPAGAAPSARDDDERPPVAAVAGPTRRASSNESALRIVVVHPDLLGTYGDGGNGRVLTNRAAWRGIAAELVVASSDQPLPRTGDIYLLGGGEDGPQAHSAAVLADGALAEAVGNGAVVLAVCAGYQILGRRFPGASGTTIAGIGLLPVETVTVPDARAVGELLVAPTAERDDTLLLTGFENHAGRTRLDPGVAPLGTVLTGVGNGDGSDGVRHGRLVGTYLHGPVLARNPSLADELLEMLVATPLSPLDDSEEHALRAERLRAARTRVAGRARR